MKSFLRITTPLVLLALSGCASLPAQQPAAAPELYRQHMQRTAQISAFSVSGRMAVQTNQRGFSGSLRWQHTAQGDRLALFSPLGSQVADISSGNDSITLTTSDQKTYTAQDAETLLLQTMGWSLPLRGLGHWVLGRPADGAFEAVDWDSEGRFTRLRQNGWEIEYSAYTAVNGISLPGKVFLKSPKLNLKLLVERWDDVTREQP